MLKKHAIWIMVVLAVVMAGCAKRNTAWQNDEILTLVKQVPIVGNPADIAFDDDNIFVAQDQGGLSLIDRDDYSTHWWTEVYPPSADAQLVNVRNVAAVPEHKLLFLGEYVSGDKIRIIDYSNPDSLKLIDSITGGTDGLQSIWFDAIPDPPDDNIVEGFFSAGRTLNYARYNGSLYLGTDYVINTPATAAGFDQDDQNIYVAAQQRGLVIYNKTSTTPQYVSEIAVPGEALAVKVAGNYAYVASRQGGLNVVNIAAPDEPILVSTYDTTGYATSVDISGTLAAVSSGSGGIYLFSLSSPGNPTLKQRLSSAGYTNNAKFNNGKLYVAARDQGLLIYEID
jgi:hypothetical protein